VGNQERPILGRCCSASAWCGTLHWPADSSVSAPLTQPEPGCCTPPWHLPIRPRLRARSCCHQLRSRARAPVPLRRRPVCCQGYGRLMQVLGSNVAEFLQNLNNLHLHLSMGWPSMMSPSFRCEQARASAAAQRAWACRGARLTAGAGQARAATIGAAPTVRAAPRCS
jgi:hypothetical protein